jgi:hypothetical protein
MCLLENLVSTATATEANVAPLVLELVTALDTATISLALLGLGLKKRQSEQDVANLIASIVSVIWKLMFGQFIVFLISINTSRMSPTRLTAWRDSPLPSLGSQVYSARST